MGGGGSADIASRNSNPLTEGGGEREEGAISLRATHDTLEILATDSMRLICADPIGVRGVRSAMGLCFMYVRKRRQKC